MTSVFAAFIALLFLTSATGGELNAVCTGTFVDLGAAIRAVPGETGAKLLASMETVAAEIDSLSPDSVLGVMTALEKKITSGKYRFASASDSFRADEALVTLALHDGIDLAFFPLIRQRVDTATSAETAFRRHIQALFESYPETWAAIPKWKTEARSVLKRDLEQMQIENPDLVARSLVNKVERRARTFDASFEATEPSAAVFEFLRAGKGGKLGSEITITGPACFAAKGFDVAVSKKLAGWVAAVEKKGMAETRLLPGYHDHPLKGEWAGYRSVYLTRSYRAIYVEKLDGTFEIIKVTKHDYRTN